MWDCSNLINKKIKKYPSFFKVFVPTLWIIDFVIVLYWNILYRGFNIIEVLRAFMFSFIQLGFILFVVSLVIEILIDKINFKIFNYNKVKFINPKIVIFIILLLIGFISYLKMVSEDSITLFASKDKFINVNETMFKSKTGKDIYEISNITCDNFNFRFKTKCEIQLQTEYDTTFSKMLNTISVPNYKSESNIVTEPSTQIIYSTYFCDIDIFGNILRLYDENGKLL